MSPIVPVGTTIVVIAKGKGNYTGEIATNYRILSAGKDISKMTFKIPSKEYTGSAVTLVDDDFQKILMGKTMQELELGKDFIILSYKNNVNKGTASALLRGIGEYGGVKTVSFKIGQRSIVDYWNGVKSFFSKLMN